VNEKTEKQFSELWERLKLEMLCKGDVREGSLPSKAEAILEMVGAMLMDDYLFTLMRGRYYDLLLPPHPDFGKAIAAAKRSGTFPRVVDVQLSGDADRTAEVIQ